jgi:HEAT repeat protein
MQVHLTSLIVGLAITMILWWVITRSRPLWRELRSTLGERRLSPKETRLTDEERDLRRSLLRRAQGMHLASPLFALDEILEEPLLVAPPARIEPDGPVAPEDVVTMTVPYMPAWPEFAAVYGAPTLTLERALAGGVQVVLIGQPGIGKTVALAHLATLAANRSESLGSLRDHVPLLLHVAQLQLPVSERQDLLARIIEATTAETSLLDVGRAAKFITSSFRNGRVLLLLDGYDELTDQGQRAVAEFLGGLVRAYPHTRIVMTGAPEYLDGLIGLGFVPLSVMPWNRRRQSHFIDRWLEAWSSSANKGGITLPGHAAIDPLVVAAWLDQNNENASALELTLKLWAACAGDGLGPNHSEAIAAHVRRLVPASTPPAALESLAMQVMLTAQPVFDPRKAREWVEEFELPDEAPDATLPEGSSRTMAAASPATGGEPDTQGRKPDPSTPGLLGKLAATGLLVSFPGSRMRFVHPVIGSFLAGRGLRVYRAGETLVNQPDWIGKLMTMRYFAANADAGPLVASMLHWSRLPMHRPALTAGRWLREAPHDAFWRSRLLAALAEVVQRPGVPLALRGQAVAALAASGDPSVSALFRALISSQDAEVAQLAALGAGVIRDQKAIPLLRGALLSTSVSARRAACLALSAIGTTPALEAVGEALLMGDDDLRRAAAEALANEPREGHAMLRDGATMADIPLRRAAAYGLGRIAEPWAEALLEQMRMEDDQWIVRNAAAELLEARLRTPDPRAPRTLIPPSECTWLIRFAGTQGVGISPGAPATALLIAALKSPHGDERLGAIDYLKLNPTEGVLKELYAAMFGGDFELREVAFQALWEIGASGYHLPDPAKYGMN